MGPQAALKNAPTPEHWQENDDKSLARKIFSMLSELGNFLLPDASGLLEDGDELCAHHVETIRRLIRSNAPIHFILPAFPAKSPNPRKTFNHLPDYGEVLALKRLDDLCSRIGKHYGAGAFITICSDGRVFSDLVEAPDQSVNEYTRQIRKIIQEHRLKNLVTYCLEDVFTESSDFDEMRAWLVKNYATPVETLRERIGSDDELKSLFNGIHRFLLEDQLVLHPEISKNKLRDRAKQLSYGVIQRSNAWSVLLENAFPGAVRLSIHPQPIHSHKIGIRLLESNDIWRTPWHSVPLRDGNKYLLISRREAEEMGARLVYVDGKYPCYTVAPGEGLANA